jgi:hypothetical protein
MIRFVACLRRTSFFKRNGYHPAEIAGLATAVRTVGAQNQSMALLSPPCRSDHGVRRRRRRAGLSGAAGRVERGLPYGRLVTAAVRGQKSHDRDWFSAKGPTLPPPSPPHPRPLAGRLGACAFYAQKSPAAWPGSLRLVDSASWIRGRTCNSALRGRHRP